MTLDQIRNRYQDYGYAHVPGLLSASDLAPLRGVIDQTVERVAQALLEKGLIDDAHRNAPWTRRLAELYRTVKKQSIGWNQEVLSKAVYDLLTFPPLLDIVEALAGPEVQANGDYWLRTKLPHEALTTFPWHQDSFYYGDPTQHLHIVSVWIPLVDVDEHNGCMEFLDHSHTWGPIATTRQGDHLGPAVDVEARGHKTVMRMKAGDAVLFHNLTLHRSLMNNSDDVRWSIDLRFAPTGTPTEWLDNMGMLGFVARSRAMPESVESWDSWRARRERFTA
jgi:phytanoyl-CoA hydroxylase